MKSQLILPCLGLSLTADGGVIGPLSAVQSFSLSPAICGENVLIEAKPQAELDLPIVAGLVVTHDSFMSLTSFDVILFVHSSLLDVIPRWVEHPLPHYVRNCFYPSRHNDRLFSLRSNLRLSTVSNVGHFTSVGVPFGVLRPSFSSQ